MHHNSYIYIIMFPQLLRPKRLKIKASFGKWKKIEVCIIFDLSLVYLQNCSLKYLSVYCD